MWLVFFPFDSQIVQFLLINWETDGLQKGTSMVYNNFAAKAADLARQSCYLQATASAADLSTPTKGSFEASKHIFSLISVDFH